MIDTQPHVTKLSRHTGAAIGAVTHSVDLENLFGHDAVLDTAFAGRMCAPLVKAAGGHTQVLAHGLDGKVGLIRLDQRIDVLSMALSLLANQAVAFAKMSRS